MVTEATTLEGFIHHLSSAQPALTEDQPMYKVLPILLTVKR